MGMWCWRGAALVMSTRIASSRFWNRTAVWESSKRMLSRGYPRLNLGWISASRLRFTSEAVVALLFSPRRAYPACTPFNSPSERGRDRRAPLSLPLTGALGSVKGAVGPARPRPSPWPSPAERERGCWAFGPARVSRRCLFSQVGLVELVSPGS